MPPRSNMSRFFDEAQRAWNLEMTANFMRRKKTCTGFRIQNPSFSSRAWIAIRAGP